MKHPTPPALGFLDEALADARRRDLLRSRAEHASGGLSFCSNDYLGLAAEPAPPLPAGTGASRLIAGDRPIHADLEAESAALVGLPEALVFSSGYAANVGLLSALAGPGDLLVSDALNHASIIDGSRLSKARIQVVPHLDVAAVDRALAAPRSGRAFVVTESYFSMDADGPDLTALRTVCDAHGAALLVDEAHALGVLGPGGRGRCVEAGVRPDALVGTFGKAFGAAGAFVAGCPALMAWLWNRARSFVFSTGVSPAVAGAALNGIRTAGARPHLRERLLAAASQLRAGLERLGVPPLGFGHIVPWVVGEPRRALRIASDLQREGLDVRAIRPPTVPAGTARLRFTVTAAHSGADVEQVLDAVAVVLRRLASEG